MTGRATTTGIAPAATSQHDGVLAPGGVAAARRRPRLSRGHVLMVVAGITGVVLSYAVLRQREGASSVLVARHEIRAGEAVVPSDFRRVRVTLDADVLTTVVRASDLDRVRGRIAGSTIAADELVARRWLRPRAAPHGRRAMSIPIDPARAVGGRLVAGDRVDVVFAGDRAVSIIVAGAEVLAVDARGHGGIGESSSPFTVTIAVSARQSQLVAAAIADGGLSLARSTGARSAKGTTPEVIDQFAQSFGEVG